MNPSLVNVDMWFVYHIESSFLDPLTPFVTKTEFFFAIYQHNIKQTTNAQHYTAFFEIK